MTDLAVTGHKVSPFLQTYASLGEGGQKDVSHIA
jgi:hypothetical protein